MNTARYIVIVLTLLITGFLTYLIGYHAGIEWESETIKVQTSNLISTEDMLAKWVFLRSEKISIDTAKLIVKEAMRTERPLLILALISVESEFNPSAISRKGAIGLTQVVWYHHGKSLIEAGISREKKDLFNVDRSIRAGDFILRGFLIQSNGNVQKALELYLGGKDSAYTKRILGNLADLYVLTGENHNAN
jgi:soluble lytic murein transglycosylase-like protein